MRSNEKYLFIFYRFAHVHPINCEIRVPHITAAGVGEWVRPDHSLTEKELPQEQPWSACGFLSTWKVERISSWLKSTVDPFTNSRLSWSTITPTPPFSNTLSSSFFFLSTENLYWNPEQPPPSTWILRYSPFSMISPNLFTHDSVRCTLSSDEPDTPGFSWVEGLL